MFGPMDAGPEAAELILWAIAVGLAVIGFLWIRRITKDIEDN